MTKESFLDRACPTCGTNSAVEEVHSKTKAEHTDFEGLRPFWSGLFKEKVFFSYSRCKNCGLLFAPHFFTDDQLAQLYAIMAPNMEDVSTGAVAATQQGYFDVARKNAPLDGGYLEIGPDIGYLVKLAAQQGRFDQFWLFEPNNAVHDTLASATNGHPFKISSDMTDLSHVPDGSVGLAVMIHVLDHLLDPIDMLRQIKAKLKPDGAIVIVTHNEHSLLRRLMGLRWPPFCLQHPQIFNPHSIKATLIEAGFNRVSVDRSVNHFPVDFMVRQAAYAAHIPISRVPLPSFSLGLKLGNIITVAS